MIKVPVPDRLSWWAQPIYQQDQTKFYAEAKARQAALNAPTQNYSPPQTKDAA